jgi:hypothetical protein
MKMSRDLKAVLQEASALHISSPCDWSCLLAAGLVPGLLAVLPPPASALLCLPPLSPCLQIDPFRLPASYDEALLLQLLWFSQLHSELATSIDVRHVVHIQVMGQIIVIFQPVRSEGSVIIHIRYLISCHHASGSNSSNQAQFVWYQHHCYL